MRRRPGRLRRPVRARGVLVAGVSTHPGKFGFVSLHNILASVDAIDFLLDKLRNTKSNADFFESMNA